VQLHILPATRLSFRGVELPEKEMSN